MPMRAKYSLSTISLRGNLANDIAWSFTDETTPIDMEILINQFLTDHQAEILCRHSDDLIIFMYADDANNCTDE